MENSRYKNLLKVFKWIVNIALYLQIASLALVPIYFIIIFGGEAELFSMVDVVVIPSPTNYNMTSKTELIYNLDFGLNKGTISFTSRGVFYILLKVLESVIRPGFGILITILLRRIVKSMQDHHPFTLENINRIRKIALLLLAFSPYGLIKSLVYRNYVINNISVEGLEYAPLFNFGERFGDIYFGLDFINLQSLLAGIILLFIAEIFRLGMNIKLDNESII